jgi:hypothetical protein
VVNILRFKVLVVVTMKNVVWQKLAHVSDECAASTCGIEEYIRFYHCTPKSIKRKETLGNR